MATKKPVFKGFSEDEIVLLYRFICKYEENKKRIEGEALTACYPNSSHWAEFINPESIKTKKAREMQKNAGKISSNDQIEQTKSKTNSEPKSSKIVSLLSHLKSSVSNGHIEKNGDSVQFSDYHNGNINAIGRVSSDRFFSFIKLFI